MDPRTVNADLLVTIIEVFFLLSFEILKAATVKETFFRNVMPCGVDEMYQCWTETHD
jgi:hypothetical protein